MIPRSAKRGWDSQDSCDSLVSSGYRPCLVGSVLNASSDAPTSWGEPTSGRVLYAAYRNLTGHGGHRLA